MNDETKCVYCGDPSAHPGTRKCSDSTACDLRMAYQDVRTLRARVAELEAMLGARHRIATAECERAGDVVEALPLDATPLADELRTLRAERNALQMRASELLACTTAAEDYAKTVTVARDALRARVAELEAYAKLADSDAEGEERRADELEARVAELERQVADLEGAVNR